MQTKIEMIYEQIKMFNADVAKLEIDIEKGASRLKDMKISSALKE